VGSFDFKTHGSGGYVDADEKDEYGSLVRSWSVNGNELTLFLKDGAETVPYFGPTWIGGEGPQPQPGVNEYRDNEIASFAGDRLEGGLGSDVYLVSSSGLVGITTIVGLNLGGSVAAQAVDKLAFASIERTDGEHEISVLVEVEGILGQGEIELNAEWSLKQALDSLFKTDAAVGAAKNAATLLHHGDDTYLMVLGEEAGEQFGSDDFIVKLEQWT